MVAELAAESVGTTADVMVGKLVGEMAVSKVARLAVLMVEKSVGKKVGGWVDH